MEPPATAVPPETNNSISPVALPVASIKTEVNVDIERGNSNNSAVDGSEEVAPSPTTGDEQPINPWLTVKCIFCHITLSPSEEPKLLECLHAACVNCITAKVNEHIPGDAEGAVDGCLEQLSIPDGVRIVTVILYLDCGHVPATRTILR